MTNERADASFSADERIRLRDLVLTIDRELLCLSREGTSEDHRAALYALATCWASFIELVGMTPSREAWPALTRVVPSRGRPH